METTPFVRPQPAAPQPAATRRPCIAGIGQTEYRRWGGHTEHNEFQLACVALLAAAQDAGIGTAEIDGLVSFADPASDPSMLQLALGIPELRYSALAWGGRGGAGCGAVALAVAAVESGQAKTVAVVRSLCQGRTRRYGKFFAARAHANFTAPFGLLSPAQMMALALQRYSYVYEQDLQEAMFQIAMACRDNAQRNPHALTHGKPLTRETYLASRPVADPLRLNDCCLESDGACAVIVTSAQRAQSLGAGTSVEIAAAAQHGPAGWSTGYMGSHNMPREDYGRSGGQRALAQHLYAQAGVLPQDIDVAQIYDHFSGMVLLSLEDFGFCGPGQAPEFVRSGHTARGGKLPINTAGGNLSEAYVHGLNLVVEGVRQLRGTSTSQVDSARLCLVSSGSGILPSSGLILRRGESQ